MFLLSFYILDFVTAEKQLHCPTRFFTKRRKSSKYTNTKKKTHLCKASKGILYRYVLEKSSRRKQTRKTQTIRKNVARLTRILFLEHSKLYQILTQTTSNKFSTKEKSALLRGYPREENHSANQTTSDISTDTNMFHRERQTISRSLDDETNAITHPVPRQNCSAKSPFIFETRNRARTKANEKPERNITEKLSKRDPTEKLPEGTHSYNSDVLAHNAFCSSLVL